MRPSSSRAPTPLWVTPLVQQAGGQQSETHAHLDIGLQALPPLLQSSGPPVGQAFRGEFGHFVQFLDLPGGYRSAITVSLPTEPKAHFTLARALPYLPLSPPGECGWDRGERGRGGNEGGRGGGRSSYARLPGVGRPAAPPHPLVQRVELAVAPRHRVSAPAEPHLHSEHLPGGREQAGARESSRPATAPPPALKGTKRPRRAAAPRGHSPAPHTRGKGRAHLPSALCSPS